MSENRNIITENTYKGNVAVLIVPELKVSLMLVVDVAEQVGVFLNPVTPAQVIVPTV